MRNEREWGGQEIQEKSLVRAGERAFERNAMHGSRPLPRRLALLAPPQLVEHDVGPYVAARKRVAVQSVELVRLVTLEKRAPFVEAELGMRNVKVFG
jgi:hypothetical protein